MAVVRETTVRRRINDDGDAAQRTLTTRLGIDPRSRERQRRAAG